MEPRHHSHLNDSHWTLDILLLLNTFTAAGNGQSSMVNDCMADIIGQKQMQCASFQKAASTATLRAILLHPFSPPSGGAGGRLESLGQLVRLGFDVTVFTPASYQRPRLGRPSCGDLILWPASCLDAFSAYPIQTRLPGGAPGGTTGRPEVCPTRSSRTSVRATQISCAHDR